MNDKDKLKKGFTELLVLKVLSEEDCYGYQITQIFKQISEGIIIVRESSLYPILYRLEEEKRISSYIRQNGRMKRVYYHLEETGREKFEKLKEEYLSVHKGMMLLLNYKKENEEE